MSADLRDTMFRYKEKIGRHRSILTNTMTNTASTAGKAAE